MHPTKKCASLEAAGRYVIKDFYLEAGETRRPPRLTEVQPENSHHAPLCGHQAGSWFDRGQEASGTGVTPPCREKVERIEGWTERGGRKEGREDTNRRKEGRIELNEGEN